MGPTSRETSDLWSHTHTPLKTEVPETCRIKIRVETVRHRPTEARTESEQQTFYPYYYIFIMVEVTQ